MVNYWVKDAEPIPRPAPTGKASALPWLDPALVEEEAEKREFARLEAKTNGTLALLKRMGIGPHGEVDLKKDRRARLEEKEAQALAKVGARMRAGTGQQPAMQPAMQPASPFTEIDVN